MQINKRFSSNGSRFHDSLVYMIYYHYNRTGTYWAPDTSLNSLNVLNPLILIRILVGKKLSSPLYWWRHWDLEKSRNPTTITFYKQSWDLNRVLLNIKAYSLKHCTNQRITQVDKITSFCSHEHSHTLRSAFLVLLHALIWPPGTLGDFHSSQTTVKFHHFLAFVNRRIKGFSARTAASGCAECALYKSRQNHSQGSIWQVPPKVVQPGSPDLAALNLVCDSLSATVSDWTRRRHLTKKSQSDACCVDTELRSTKEPPQGCKGRVRGPGALPSQTAQAEATNEIGGKGTQGEMKEFMELLRDPEKSLIFPFPRISSDPVILLCSWFLRDFCVSFQQTLLCICLSLRASRSLQDREVPILDQTSSNGIFHYYTKTRLESQLPDSCV